MLFEKDFYSLTYDDLKRLIENEVPEDRYLEYKLDIPGNSYDDVKEFLADVSAFANASGGTILFGITEESGIPVSIDGLDIEDIDSEILRLQDIIRNSIKPVISQIFIRSIDVSDSRKVLIISIAQSWSAPHVVEYKKHWRFYTRTSAGKHPMDIQEVREKMLQSNTLSEKMDQFRNERLALIKNGDYPIKLISDSIIALHLIPFSALFSKGSSAINFNVITQNFNYISPLNSSVKTSKYNLEGYINFGFIDDKGGASGYVQIYRNGIIESVDSSILGLTSIKTPSLRSGLVEREIVNKVKIYLEYQRRMGVLPPIVLFASFLNIRGYYLSMSDRQEYFGDVLHRDSILIPEIIFEDFPDDIPIALRDLFDRMWNAFGWERSLSYDDKGNWIGTLR